ncbi:MAG TPA: hypothetical protein VMF07_13935 [Solirubrobacteraceae bacterium]|nr:hypothetical protein [Solirubrobacteraceae bacterium]
MAAVKQDQSALQATLELATGVIGSGDGLSYSVVNVGSAPLLFDSSCQIEWATDSGWIPLPVTVEPAAAVTILEPAGRSEPQDCVHAEHLLSGHYRLTKQVVDATEPRPGALTIRREFSVQTHSTPT